MIRCPGSGPGGSVKSAPALRVLPHLLPPRRVAARVLRPPPNRQHRHLLRLRKQPRTLRPPTLLARLPFVAARPPTSPRSRPSMTPPPLPRPRFTPRPRRHTRPPWPPLHHRLRRPLRSLRRHRFKPPRRTTTVASPRRLANLLPLRRHLLRLRHPHPLLCVLRLWPARRRRLRVRCRRRTPARRPPPIRGAAADRRRRVRRCVQLPPVCLTVRVPPVPVCRRAGVPARVAVPTPAVRVPWRLPRRRSVARRCVRPVLPADSVRAVDRRQPVARRVPVATRVVAVARRASVAPSIRRPSMRTSRRR